MDPNRSAHPARVRFSSAVIGIALLAMAGCAARSEVHVAANQTATFTGTVTYQERVALPSDAVVEVWVSDASQDGLGLPGVGETAFLTDGRQVPIAFEVHYDPSRVDPSHQYTARAVIRNNGEVLFATTMPTFVLTQGNPSQVELVLSRSAPGFGR